MALAARPALGRWPFPAVLAGAAVIAGLAAIMWWRSPPASDPGQIQRDAGIARRTGATGARKAAEGGMFSALSGLFSFGAAHPLVGEWAVDNSNTFGGFLGAALPFKGGRLTFGKDYMQSGADRVKARFDVSGDVVTVQAEGEGDALKFRMKDKNTMVMDVGLAEIPFNRVR